MGNDQELYTAADFQRRYLKTFWNLDPNAKPHLGLRNRFKTFWKGMKNDHPNVDNPA